MDKSLKSEAGVFIFFFKSEIILWLLLFLLAALATIENVADAS